MVVGRFALGLTLSVSVLSGACDADDACDSVAVQLRACCDKGPAELRDACLDEAKALENDGNTDACQTDVERGTFARCNQ